MAMDHHDSTGHSLRRSEVTTDAGQRLPLIIALPLLPFQSKAFKQLRDASIKCLAGDIISTNKPISQ